MSIWRLHRKFHLDFIPYITSVWKTAVQEERNSVSTQAKRVHEESHTADFPNVEYTERAGRMELMQRFANRWHSIIINRWLTELNYL